MIEKIINKDVVEVNVEVENWEGAVKAAGDILVKNNKVKETYIEAMIDTVKAIGPYIVMAPGIAMPHARPECGVIDGGISIITLKEPVNFGNKEFDPVKLIFALCAKESESHIELLKDLSVILDDDKVIEKCSNIKTKDELIEILLESYKNNK
ncbi:PTS sugar transporter subunit IIA [Clostridium gasigenes]|uniref:PTS system IIA component, L-Asc family n=1 Tax=Clostridium gasigenes TaxID=94869 RepID=A0A1H0VKF2_9CLOT|nr:PTS sugar transporter subunit IIA [Clostridium gasigenes]SDP78698.1 PTS system IIA component, L-Asc family [Clostridium gasigenes]